MITNNFKKIISGFVSGRIALHPSKLTNYDVFDVRNPTTGTYDTFPYVNTSGVNAEGYIKGYSFQSASTAHYFCCTNESTVVVFGTGDTAPTAEDYYLENRYSGSDLVLSKSTYYVEDEQGIFYIKIDISATYTGADSITLKEVGLFHLMVAPSGSSYTLKSDCMLLREVLAEPLVLSPQNSTETISLFIKMD